eukprot:IDg15331t1
MRTRALKSGAEMKSEAQLAARVNSASCLLQACVFGVHGAPVLL